jgi:hypothetical protein
MQVLTPPHTAGSRGYVEPAIPKTALMVATLGLFVCHAANYLYFFVDDEGIPFIFARHLLEGRGLVYNSFEGRVEGYSDLLHILTSAGWLFVGDVLGLSRLAPFFLGKAISFLAGIAVVWVVCRSVARDSAMTRQGQLASVVFLALAPPLAIWACSSLEMVPVTLLVAIVTVNLISTEPTIARDRWTALAACLLVLYRIDGVVFAALLLVPAWLAADAVRRRELSARVLLPFGLTVLGYHTWRVWYFGDWTTGPLAAKVLYKLHSVHDIAIKSPERPYGRAFVELYGIWPVGFAVAFCLIALRRQRRAWPLLVSTCLLAAYASIVGDWMVGFRFFLPLLPAVTLLLAFAVSAVRAPVAWAVVAALVVWCPTVAVKAAAKDDRMLYRDSWWRHPSFDRERYFSQYLRLYEELRSVVPPGTRTAYNQAGFVPFMLDADNVDDLGVCSRFVAHLPTTDVVFTEVGRYSPLTNRPALRAAHAYLLALAPEFIIEPYDNLDSANGGNIPETVLRSHYRRLLVDRHAQAVVYKRTPGGLDGYRTDPNVFLENVAHPSHLIRAYDGDVIGRGQFLHRLPFLADGTLDRSFSGRLSYEATFGTVDIPVYELDVLNIWARTDVRLTISLMNAKGDIAAREELVVGPSGAQILREWPDGVRASQVAMQLEAMDSAPTRVILHDMRVQGQTPEFAAYVRALPFMPRDRSAAGLVPSQ